MSETCQVSWQVSDIRNQPRRSAAPPFRTGEVEWVCWITSDNQRYIWRGAEDRLLAGRYVGRQEYWAKVDGIALPQVFKSLRAAMVAAYRASLVRTKDALKQA